MIVFTDTTVNFQKNVPSHLVGRLMLDGKEQKETRTLQGNYIIDSLNTGFVTKLSKGDHKIHFEYRSPSPLTGEMNNPQAVWQDNRYLGGVLLYGGLKFHKKEILQQLPLKKTDVWTKLDQLKLPFSLETDRPVLFFYNLAYVAEVSAGARLLIDGKVLKSTYKRVAPAHYAGLFGVACQILTAGNHELNLEFVAGKSANINGGASDWESSTISVAELPITSVLHEKSLETVYNIAPNEWTPLGNLKYDLKIEREKNALVYYSATFNMKRGNWAVYTRVVDNGKEIIKSRSSSSNGDIAGISAQFLLNLKIGKHELVLQYFTGEKDWKIDPNDNFQAATFNIIEFEAEKSDQQ